jgi:hypothetical protein
MERFTQERTMHVFNGHFDPINTNSTLDTNSTDTSHDAASLEQYALDNFPREFHRIPDPSLYTPGTVEAFDRVNILIGIFLKYGKYATIDGIPTALHIYAQSDHINGELSFFWQSQDSLQRTNILMLEDLRHVELKWPFSWITHKLEPRQTTPLHAFIWYCITFASANNPSGSGLEFVSNSYVGGHLLRKFEVAVRAISENYVESKETENAQLKRKIRQMESQCNKVAQLEQRMRAMVSQHNLTVLYLKGNLELSEAVSRQCRDCGRSPTIP